VLGEQYAAELGQSVRRIVERADDLFPLGDRERDDLRFSVVGRLEPFGRVDEAGLTEHACELENVGVTHRIDVAESTRKMYRSHLRKIGETFAGRDPHSITAADVAEWVAAQADVRKPGTVAQYLDAFKLLLDYIGIEPNPARDPRVKLPKRVTEEANPPSDEHFLGIVDKLLARWRLFFITIEQGGLRIGEAVSLRWADDDVAGSRLRLPRSATKTGTSRWVQLPTWLMEALEATCPLEDRVP